ncbi:MAG: UbiX family flavin prenyltransferase [Gemmatimonadaceae bacterium]|nr:UbiX family flavin prenyltransferase [Gemmatimonadaceae bacterium]
MWLIVSSHGWRLLQTESGIHDLESLRAHVGEDAWDASVTVFDDNDRGATPASGSARVRGMVIVPCSMGTIASIAAGTSRSLVERAADVTLKERRRLIVVQHDDHRLADSSKNMLRLTDAGAVVLPAAPGFYHGPERIDQLVDFVVQRILDQLDVDVSIAPRWGDPVE